MAITRSQIARQLLQQGGVSMVDPRMQRSLEENIARNNAAREINQAMRKPGGLRDLYQKYGFSMYSARYGNIYTVKQLLQLAQEVAGERKPQNYIWKKNE